METCVQSFRGVGSRRGFCYFAWGLYRPHTTRSGKRVWRLVRSGPWRRSDVHGKTAFPGVPRVEGIRNNSPVRE